MIRRAVAFPVAVAVAASASGWLYLVRASGVPGPRAAEALPLDELAGHAAAPLAWYAAVWGAAALLLAAYARWARVDRTVAALLLPLAFGLWTYLDNGVSIAVTRQIPARDAFDAAAQLNAVYLPAVLAGLAAAALARPRRRGRRAPLVVALFVAAAGAIDVLHVVLPGEGEGLVRSLEAASMVPVARASAALAGVTLLIAARGLARRRRRAWQVAVAVAALATVLHALRGFDEGSLAVTAALVMLLARRHDFGGVGDVETRRDALTRAAVGVVVIAAYGVGALWLNRVAADQPFTLRFAADEVARGLVGLRIHGSPHLTGSFGDWFPLSLLLLGLALTAWVVAAWVAPSRHRVRQAALDRELAHELVQAWGADTLAPFALRADKSYFFSDDRRAFLAYRVVGAVAIVAGDPIGPPECIGPLVERFIAYAHDRDWRVAILGASESRLDLYRSHGLHALYHGDEAVVDTASFSLEGRPIRKVRQSVHRLRTAGFTARVLRPSEIGPELRGEFEAIAAAWRGTEPERGFVMALDALFDLDDDDALFVVGFDRDGRPAGFLHLAVACSASALSLSSMPRLRSTPNGFNEWLICETIEWARGHGYASVSLNFSPFAALLAPGAELGSTQAVQRRALLALKGHFQLDNLLLFNRKFFPRWVRRFVVYERRLDLPRVGIAALAAEAYLPFQRARR